MHPSIISDHALICDNMAEGIYSYSDQGRSMRLVRLLPGSRQNVECELVDASLDTDIIPYKAVSYTWGSLVTTDVIHINGKRLRITLNLYSLLQEPGGHLKTLVGMLRGKRFRALSRATATTYRRDSAKA